MALYDLDECEHAAAVSPAPAAFYAVPSCVLEVPVGARLENIYKYNSDELEGETADHTDPFDSRRDDLPQCILRGYGSEV